ncbi:Rieske (2Fe-2S) protein [Halomarina ordinaria]|uniref:Rieske (2Fe-2S) protein n=1 Tax=Halomarina ordinaria TaxID=3033939 RepID=A0ABD5UC31_9EURY|nr:Rieske 2Fe-2S domain-containing protein [Halomarina sp. PSRA2]
MDEEREERRIAGVDEVPADGTLLFTVREGFDTEEAILVAFDADDDGASDDADDGDGTDGAGDGRDVTAWRNFCPHWTDVRLDKGSGAAVRNGEVVCQRHGATFEKDSGHCTFGPCEGAYLDEVDVVVENGAVYLADDRYEFANLGPSGDHDRSTGGRIDF